MEQEIPGMEHEGSNDHLLGPIDSMPEKPVNVDKRPPVYIEDNESCVRGEEVFEAEHAVGGTRATSDAVHSMHREIVTLDAIRAQLLDWHHGARDGDEGVPEHLIQDGQGCLAALREILNGLAQNAMFTRHGGTLPTDEDYSFGAVLSRVNSPAWSELDSLMVELSSGEHSLMPSLYMSPRSSSPSTFDFMDSRSEHSCNEYLFCNAGPLRLTPDSSMHSSMELPMQVYELDHFDEYDMM